MEEYLFSNINPEELVTLFDYIPDVQFWIKDSQSVFQWVNKTFLDNYDLKEFSDLVGKTDYDLSPFYIAEQFVRDDQEVLQGKVVKNRIELVSSLDQTLNWCITNKRPIISKSCEIIGTLGITRKLNNQQNPEIPIARLSEIVNYIHENIHHPISIANMADIMNCSISTLERTFKNLLQASPMEFTRKIKMQYACKALISNNSLISELAFSLGYADESHFIREFKKLMKITPLQYRKQYFNLSKK